MNKKKVLLIGIALVLAIAGGGALYTFATLSYSYSTGERVGYVQKLSKRGWFCKTDEGDLAMISVPGQTAEHFAFTVRDEKVVKSIDALSGHKVVLNYDEHRGIPLSCFGDTMYFVTGVRQAD